MDAYPALEVKTEHTASPSMEKMNREYHQREMSRSIREYTNPFYLITDKGLELVKLMKTGETK